MPEKSRDLQGRWMSGSSGNPGGRPSGSGHVARLRAELAQELPGIIESLIRQAKGGDVAAIRVVLDRVIPPLKAVDAPLSLELPEGGFTPPKDAQSLPQRPLVKFQRKKLLNLLEPSRT
jgi:hypothetical protein